MAKCTICNSRKGKRKCKATETFICSLCCGESRIDEQCDGCSFFKSAVAARNYRSVPHFTTEQMAGTPDLQDIADVVEAALCLIWANDPRNVTDREVTRLVELMIDRHHFKDREPQVNSAALDEGFRLLVRETGEALSQIQPEDAVKVLAAVHRSILRRSVGGNSYLQFISQFTGIKPNV